MFTKNFKELSKNDASIAGGKGASLGEMTEAGIPVPPGFVVLSDAFEKFLSETDLNVEIESILATVDNQKMHTVENASEKIQLLILEAQMPQDIKKEIESEFKKLDAQFIAVRSSATAEDGAEAAWAGQLNSYLNTVEENLLPNIQKCWASLFTPRAIFYRFEKNLHKDKISVAVVVQKMIQSKKSGIAFSVHPVTQDYNQLIIEAGFGLGEAIVSGSITPDSYVVEKDSKKILDINVNTQTKGLYRACQRRPACRQAGISGNEWRELGEKGREQVLSKKEILELSDLIIKIENHYGFPCDIEWAQENGKFYIIQSRPITTLIKTDVSKKGGKIILSKYMSREHSIFYAHVWNEANRDYFDDHIPHTNIKNMLFSLNKIGVLDVYYDLGELNEIFDRIAKNIIEKPQILDDIIVNFYNYWDKLIPYISKKKTVGTKDELREFYINWMRWWSPMAYVFVIPDRKGVPEELRQRALRVREETQEYSDEGDKIFMGYMESHYPKYKNIAHLFTPDEVFNIEILSQEEIKSIKERKDGCALITLNGQSTLILLSELENELSANNASVKRIQLETASNLKGSPASSGIVQGKVRLVLTKAALENIESGEIMVTYATSPDYVPAMKKCSAIVTDEGGVVCHAAIVAREMKKPCIIGTKIATQILKDGDLVEVDAERGVVKILIRAQDK